MKKEDCTIGAEVYTTDGIGYRYTLTSLPNEDGMVNVVPTEQSSGEMEDFHIDDLYLYDFTKVQKVAADLQAKVDAATNALEVAFAALKELRDSEYQDGVGMHDLTQIKLLSLKELEQTVERGGWNKSQLWC